MRTAGPALRIRIRYDEPQVPLGECSSFLIPEQSEYSIGLCTVNIWQGSKTLHKPFLIEDNLSGPAVPWRMAFNPHSLLS